MVLATDYARVLWIGHLYALLHHLGGNRGEVSVVLNTPATSCGGGDSHSHSATKPQCHSPEEVSRMLRPSSLTSPALRPGVLSLLCDSMPGVAPGLPWTINTSALMGTANACWPQTAKIGQASCWLYYTFPSGMASRSRFATARALGEVDRSTRAKFFYRAETW